MNKLLQTVVERVTRRKVLAWLPSLLSNPWAKASRPPDQPTVEQPSVATPAKPWLTVVDQPLSWTKRVSARAAGEQDAEAATSRMSSALSPQPSQPDHLTWRKKEQWIDQRQEPFRQVTSPWLKSAVTPAAVGPFVVEAGSVFVGGSERGEARA